MTHKAKHKIQEYRNTIQFQKIATCQAMPKYRIKQIQVDN